MFDSHAEFAHGVPYALDWHPKHGKDGQVFESPKNSEEKQHPDGHILVTYVKELNLEEPPDEDDCCDICWTRTNFTTARTYEESQMLCARCEPKAICAACRVFVPASVNSKRTEQALCLELVST